MLVLAGVSINAIIGDNGVITNAQKANILNSCAILQDFLHEKYISYYEESEKYNTALDLMKDKHPTYFFKNEAGYVLDQENHAMYLINKSGLPEEIKEQIQSGEASSLGDYYNQRDVYGVTSDLKVYYCQNGIDTILGLTKEDLDLDNPLVTIFEEGSDIANIINDGKPMSSQDLKKITSLTIDNVDQLVLLSGCKNFPNLITIDFKNINISTLNGIGGAPKLCEVRFENCTVGNYSDLGKCKTLNKLYLIYPGGGDTDVENLCSKSDGIGADDLPNLHYFGIVGYKNTIQSLEKIETIFDDGSDRTSHYEVTSVDVLNNLTDTTKQAVNYLYLNNLQVESFENALVGFTNLYVLRCEYNYLRDLKGLENSNQLLYLFAAHQGDYFGKFEDEDDYNELVDALAPIQNIDSLVYLSLGYNSEFKWVKYIKNMHNLATVDLFQCDGILDFEEIVGVVSGLNVSATYPGEFGSSLLSEDVGILDLTNATVKQRDFKKLSGNSNLTALNLRSAVLTADDGTTLSAVAYNKLINDVLSTCTSMKYLEISYQEMLTSIDFVSNMPDLIELNLFGDNSLTDLSPLETLANANLLSLQTLMLSNTNIELKEIQGVISNLCEDLWTDECEVDIYKDGGFYGSYWYKYGRSDSDTIYGLILENGGLRQQLAGCKNITNLVMSPGWRGLLGDRGGGPLNLSNCIKLKRYDQYFYNLGAILPSSVEEVWFGFNYGFLDLSNCTNLKKIRTFSVSIEYFYRNLVGSLPEGFSSLELLYLNDQVSLRKLNEETNRIEDFLYTGFDFLEAFSNCSNFKTFILKQNNSFGNYLISDLSGLAYAKNLEHLELRFTKNDRTSGCVADFPDLSDLKNLKFLKIEYGNMDLSNINTCKALEELIINNTLVTNVDFLSDLSNLKDVDFTNNKIGDLCGLAGKLQISSLKLGNNNITDVTVLKNLSNLSYLEINNNKLCDFSYDKDGKSYYVQTVFTDLNQNNNLKELYLNGNLFDNYEIISSSDLEWDKLVLYENDD